MNPERQRELQPEQVDLTERAIDTTASVLRFAKFVISGALRGAIGGAVEAISIEQQEREFFKKAEEYANDPVEHKKI